MSNKVLGEITVQFDDGERKFNVRRRKSTEQARLFAMLRLAAGSNGLIKSEEEDGLKISAETFDVEKYAAFHIETCRTALSDAEGKHAFTADEIDEWGSDNIKAVVEALDKFLGPAKTSVEHSGNS